MRRRLRYPRTSVLFFLGAVLAAASIASTSSTQVLAHKVGSDYRLDNGRVRLVLERTKAGFLERLFAKRDDRWELVLAGSGESGATIDLRYDAARVRPFYSRVTTLTNGLRLEASAGGHSIVTDVFLGAGETTFRYRVGFRSRGSITLQSIEASYRFLPDRPVSSVEPLDVAWCPGQRVQGGIVLGDQAFYSPLALMSKDGRTAMLVANVARIPESRQFKTAMRFCAGAPFSTRGPAFSYGALDYRPYGHVYFRHDRSMSHVVRDFRIAFGYRLDVAAKVAPGTALSRAARFLWRELGAPHVDGTIEPQYAPLRRTARAGMDWAFNSPYAKLVWHEFTYNGTRCGGTDGYITFDRRRKGQVTNEPLVDGIFFTAWFNNMWTAYGMALLGVETGDPSLVIRALRVKALSTLAPEDEGLTPSAFDPATMTWRGAEPTIPDPKRPNDYYYHLPDAAWTGYWWLRWVAEIAVDPPLERKAIALADGLLALQSPSGGFPTWVSKTRKPRPELNDSASTAAMALFLSRAAGHFNDAKYAAAADRALDFLEREIVPDSKWWDFEAMVSGVGPHLKARDPGTGQYDANTLSMLWAAAAFADAYERTRRRHLLALGARVVDELSLYQHLYDKSWHYGIKSFGGFTAQNRDAEHNDARQAIAAPLFMRYYRLTGRDEYFHRGVAALRACYSNMYVPENRPITEMLELLFPWFGPEDHGFMEENAFHVGDVAVPFVMRASNFNWGPGSAATATAEAVIRHGDVYVDWARTKAFGIDGLIIEANPLGGGMELVVIEALGVGRTVRILADGVGAGRTLGIIEVSNHALGRPRLVPAQAHGAAATLLSFEANETRRLKLWVQ